MEGGGVAAQGRAELTDAGVDAAPGAGVVFEAGSVGFPVIGNGLSRREEALCGVVPFVVGVHLLKLESVRVCQILELLEVVAAALDRGEMVVDVRDGFDLARVLFEDGVDLVAFSFWKFLDGRVGAQLLQATDEPCVPRRVEGIDAGSLGLGHVRAPVSAELVRRPSHDRRQHVLLPRLDREQRALEAALCLDQRLALARHGGQVGRVRAVLRQHRAGLGEQGLRPLPPVAEGGERRGTFGAVRRQLVRPCGQLPDLPANGLAPGMIVEPRGDNFLRVRR